ncbi:exo-beta-1,3-glucanase [Infundibulicybe gibba]|nr:exo-beta-1,3-glucanase [Infundibulicybe gibba]
MLYCTSLGPGNASPNDPFWLESIKHQGIAAYNPSPSSYKVFRNVKDFGAVGDGVTDDTAAINRAISTGDRCGQGNCESSTITPALVYFPKGEYLVSSPITPYYYTQLVGDAKNPPTLLASGSFTGMAVIDADPYIPGGGGAQWFINQNNFFRSVRNFVIDVRRVPFNKTDGTGIHWQVSQATSLTNIVFEMSTANGTAHQGIWMENGSGGYMGDLVFNGGKFGMWVGNQQFTVRNVTINNAVTAVFNPWNWGWTYQGITINNCQVGFDLLTGGLTAENQSTGAVAIIDAIVNDTPIFIRSSLPSNSTLRGSLVINNAKLRNVSTAVGVAGGAVVLSGGTKTIESWSQGNIYEGTNSQGTFTQGEIPSPNKPSVLLDGAGRVVGKTRPQYADYSVDQFVSVRDHGATGDGITDDTAAIRAILERFSKCRIIFFDAGTYIVSSTITIPAGTHIVGEAWTVIAGKGPAFEDPTNPQVVIRVGEEGSVGVIEISDIIFSTVGPAGGAIVVEWNIREPEGQKGAAGMWDSHIRLAGAAGTNLDASRCPAGSQSVGCMAAFLALHLTARSTAYLEGTWVWLADHDLDGSGIAQLTAFAGRGILSESAGPVWMIGTAAEHFVLYQYRLAGAKNHYMGLIQTETPYYQPVPVAPAPFVPMRHYKDPTNIASAWGLSVEASQDILIFGAGLYSFFNNYKQDCLKTRNCQAEIADIDLQSSVDIFSLSTVASTYQLSVGGRGIINQGDNVNGFASTVTRWRSAPLNPSTYY